MARSLWLNVQDLPADAAAASRIVAGKRAQKLLQAVQRWLFNRADVWSSISPIMIERLEQLRDRHQPVMFLPNWLHQSIADQIRGPAEQDRPHSGTTRSPALRGQHRREAGLAPVLQDSERDDRSVSSFRSTAMEAPRRRSASGWPAQVIPGSRLARCSMRPRSSEALASDRFLRHHGETRQRRLVLSQQDRPRAGFGNTDPGRV